MMVKKKNMKLQLISKSKGDEEFGQLLALPNSPNLKFLDAYLIADLHSKEVWLVAELKKMNV